MTITKDNQDLKTYNRRLVNYWLLGLLFLIVLMILIGGLTRLTDSGLSITNWKPIMGAIPPLKYADWVTLFDQYKLTNEFKYQNFNMSFSDFKVIFWWEWGHRQFGRLIGLFWFFGFAYLLITTRLPLFFKISFFCLGLLGLLQAFIGWWMVKSGLTDNSILLDVASYRLAIHLNLALIITCIIYLLIKINNSLNNNHIELSYSSKFFVDKFLMSLFILFVFIQITLGALVSGIDAGKSYNEWPLMDSQFIPPDIFYLQPFSLNFIENPATVQFNHRMMGYLIFLFGLFIWLKNLFAENLNSTIKINYNLLFFLIIIQVIAGIFALVYAVPIILGLIHQLGAVILLLTAVNLRYNLSKYSN